LEVQVVEKKKKERKSSSSEITSLSSLFKSQLVNIMKAIGLMKDWGKKSNK